MTKDVHESFRPRIKSLKLVSKIKQTQKLVKKKKKNLTQEVIKETSKHIKNSAANLFCILFSCTSFISGMIYTVLMYYIQSEIFSDGWF